MKQLFLALLPALTGLPALSPTHPFMVRADRAADHLIEAMEREGIPEGHRALWGKRAFVWAYGESGLTVDALGDAGASCGYLQAQTPGKWLTGATCDSVRKDGVQGFRVGLRLMKMLIDKCGSVRSGLSNYATGVECPKWTAAIVVKRMKLAGEWP